MALGKGWESHIGFGHETVWGTAVAPTNFIDHAGIDGGQVQPNIEGDTFRGRSNRIIFRGAKKDEMTVETELQYEGHEDPILHLFGKVTTSTVNAIFQHDFTVDDTEVPIGLTIEVKYGAAATLRHAGMKVDQGTFSADVDKIVRGSFNVAGKEEASASPGSATYSTSPHVKWDKVTVEKDDTLIECVSAQVILANNYITDRRVLGNAAVKEHTYGRRAVTGTITAWFENLTDWQADFLADTELKLEVNATSTVQIPGSGPADFYDFLLTIDHVKLDAHQKPISDAGPLLQTIPFTGFAAANEIIKLTITGGRTTVP